MRFHGVALLIALVLPGHVLAQGSRQNRTRTTRSRVTGRCLLRVQSPETSPRIRNRPQVFSARDAYDLRFDVWLRASQTSRPAEVKIFMPNGSLYRVLPVGAEDSSSVGGPSNGLSVLSARFPVAGTQITSRSVYGTWRAEAFFVGEEKACSRRLEFEIAR